MDMKGALKLVRRIRHDFGNHLQVVSGYIDMDMPERVKEYIQGVVEQMEAERAVFNLLEAEVALHFYWHVLKALDMGIVLRYDDLDLKNADLLMEMNEPYRSLLEVCKDIADKDEEPIVYLSIYEDENGYDLMFTCEHWADEDQKVRLNR